MGGSDSEIYREHKDDLVRYAAALVGADWAEDVVATVVMRVLARRSLADLDEARPYLFRAVLNEARTVIARRKPLVLFEAGDVVADPQPEVLEAVRNLPVRQRAATFLVYWGDLSISETAHLMGTRPGTVKRYLHLARNTMRGALDGSRSHHT
jgi:RNA polymerase sigma factor (sigma-70 family)